jgi:hypothetical protein
VHACDPLPRVGDPNLNSHVDPHCVVFGGNFGETVKANPRHRRATSAIRREWSRDLSTCFSPAETIGEASPYWKQGLPDQAQIARWPCALALQTLKHIDWRLIHQGEPPHDFSLQTVPGCCVFALPISASWSCLPYTNSDNSLTAYTPPEFGVVVPEPCEERPCQSFKPNRPDITVPI